MTAPRRRLLGLGLATAACIGAGVLAGQVAPAPAAGGRPVVMVSGRDDHGLLATDTVALAGTPGGTTRGTVADATLVAVLRTRGEWLEVRALTGPPVQGWVNDFYLRATLHLRAPAGRCEVGLAGDPGGTATAVVPANTQAEIISVRPAEGHTWVKVRTAGGSTGWVNGGAVHELPGDGVVSDGNGCRTLASVPGDTHDHSSRH